MSAPATEISRLEERLAQAQAAQAERDAEAERARQQRRRQWAEDALAAYPAVSATRAQVVEKAREAFTRSIADGNPFSRYVAWAVAFEHLRAAQARASRAAAILGADPVAPVHDSYRPLPFLQAVDGAIEEALRTVRVAAGETLAAELAAVDAGDDRT